MGLKIIIVGAGNAGPVLALYLKKAGHEPIICDIFDPSSSTTTEHFLNDKENSAPPLFFGDVGGAVAIQPNGQRILKDLGLLDKVLETRCKPLTEAVFSGIDGRKSVILPNTSVGDDYAAILVMRMQLQWIVGKACSELGIKFLGNKKLVSIDQTTDPDSATAIFSDGSTETGDVIVGADGVHSATRVSTFGTEFRSIFANRIDHIGVCDLGSDTVSSLDHQLAFYNDRANNRIITSLRTSDTNGVWHISELELAVPESPAVAADVFNNWRPVSDLPKESSRLADLVKQWGAPPKIVAQVRHARRITAVPIYTVPHLPAFHRGRVVLIGDAAHAMIPRLGQGVNMALEDAGVLGTLFERLGDDWKTCFELFDRVRVGRTQKLADENRIVAEIDGAKHTKTIVRGITYVAKYFGFFDEVADYDFKSEVEKYLVEQ
ncbi:hypothetical protein HK100_007446 [Physocladia obscura]|uniref:FAD-binding domain-containing protein n=1 Tax=Physocladia obscura TaxID=109957 RepID=A0AAD5XK19_9FUNG|nr:hypothetical protein HK100_007446 [Physocladia obscura]